MANNRRGLYGAILVVAAAALGLALYFGLRGGHEPAAKPAPPAADPWAKKPSIVPPRQGLEPTRDVSGWLRDVDPDGPLRLEGQVVDQDGNPVGGANVTLASVPPKSTKTEADGGFAFDKLVAREYGLSASSGNQVAGPITHHLTATSQPVVLHLVPGGTLVVSVVDTDKHPIANATVASEPGALKATTDNDGSAKLSPLHAGWVSIQASAPGYGTASTFQQMPPGGANGTATLVLRKGYSISGRVVDEAGKPVAHARVTTASVYDIASAATPTTTDDKGVFELPGLAPETYTVIASDGEHAPARSQAVTITNAPVTGVELVMTTGGVVTGTVVDPKGVPVPFATVRIAGEGQTMFLVDRRQATTDQQGAFEVRGLVRTKLVVRAEGETAASSVTNVDLTTKPERRDLKLVLDVSGTIAGIVVDGAGQPVPEIQVSATPDFLGGAQQDMLVIAGMTSDVTDGGGHFTIHGLPEGAYRVHASRASRGRYQFGSQGVAAKTGDTNVKITLAVPGSIKGKLVLENGKPPALAQVYAAGQPPVPAREDGTFVVTDVEPATLDLIVRGPGFAELTVPNIKVDAGKETDAGTLKLVRGRTVTGKVIDSSGAPVGGVRVRAGEMLVSMQGAEDQMAAFEQMAGQHDTTSLADGSFSLAGLSKKATSVMADDPTRGRSNAIEIAGGADDPPPLTLTLRGYGSITGTVTSQGKPVSGASVTASPKGGGSQLQIAQSGTDGSFTLAKVTEGTVVLSAMEQSMATMSMKSASVEVQVSSGQATKVTLDIPVGSITLTVDVKPQGPAQLDAAQVFLMRGVVAMHTAKEINDAFAGGHVAGMKFWFGAGKPPAAFSELVAGDYSVCSIPITGDLNNPTFQQRLQAHLDVLVVYCKQAKVAEAPAAQTIVQELPAMAPLPE